MKLNEPDATKNKSRKPLNGGPTAKEVNVNGQTFESIAAFARHLSLDPAKVRSRIKSGENPQQIWHSEKKYEIDGVEFDSIKSLAEHYSTTEEDVQKGLDNGLSIAQSVGVSFVPHNKNNNTLTLSVDGKSYSNIDSLVKSTGVEKSEFTKLLANSKTPQEAVDALRSSKPKSKVSRKSKPITVAGVKYPSENAAAKAYGVSASAFYQRRKKGMSPEEALDLSNKSDTKGQSQKKKGNSNPVEATAARSKPVTCHGKKYKSQRALCREFEISPHAFRHAISSGLSVNKAVDTLSKKAVPKASGHHNAKSVTYDNVTYPSIQALSDAYGVASSKVAYRLKTDKPLDDLLVEKVNEPKGIDVSPQEVIYRNKAYRSIRAFALHFNQSPSQVRYRLKNGWSPAQAIGKGKPPKSKVEDSGMVNIKKLMPVTVEGKEYKTAAALAENYNFPSSVVTGRLRNGWSPESAVELKPHRVGKNSSFLRVGDQTFANARELANAYKKPYRTVQYRLSQGATAPEAVGIKEWKGNPHRGKPITYEGVKYKSKKALTDAFGVDYNQFLSRISRGWSIDKSLNEKVVSAQEKPSKTKSKNLTTNEISLEAPINLGKLKFKSVVEFAESLELDPHLVAKRLSKGWTSAEIAGVQSRKSNN
jgi:hypothetical protein